MNLLLALLLAQTSPGIDSVRAKLRAGQYEAARNFARLHREQALQPSLQEAYHYLEILAAYNLKDWPYVIREGQAFLDRWNPGERWGYVAYMLGRALEAQQAPVQAFRIYRKAWGQDPIPPPVQAKLERQMAGLLGLDSLQRVAFFRSSYARTRLHEESRRVVVWLPPGGEAHPVARAFLQGLRWAFQGDRNLELRLQSGEMLESFLAQPFLVLVGPLLSRQVKTVYPVLESRIIPTILPFSLYPFRIPRSPWIFYGWTGDLRFLDEVRRLAEASPPESVVILYEEGLVYERLARKLARELPRPHPETLRGRRIPESENEKSEPPRLLPYGREATSITERLNLVALLKPRWIVVLGSPTSLEWILQGAQHRPWEGRWFLPPTARGTPPPGYRATGSMVTGWAELRRVRQRLEGIYRQRFGSPPDPLVLWGYDVGQMLREAVDQGGVQNGLELAVWLRARGVYPGFAQTWILNPERFQLYPEGIDGKENQNEGE